MPFNLTFFKKFSFKLLFFLQIKPQFIFCMFYIIIYNHSTFKCAKFHTFILIYYLTNFIENVCEFKKYLFKVKYL